MGNPIPLDKDQQKYFNTLLAQASIIHSNIPSQNNISHFRWQVQRTATAFDYVDYDKVDEALHALEASTKRRLIADDEPGVDSHLAAVKEIEQLLRDYAPGHFADDLDHIATMLHRCHDDLAYRHSCILGDSPVPPQHSASTSGRGARRGAGAGPGGR